MYQIFQNFESLYNILHILTQVTQTSCLVTHFCAQAVFKVSVSNTIPTHKMIKFEIILVLDVPESVKRIRLTESFRRVNMRSILHFFAQLPSPPSPPRHVSKNIFRCVRKKKFKEISQTSFKKFRKHLSKNFKNIFRKIPAPPAGLEKSSFWKG